jgi:protein-disulfide isomerase
MQFSWERAQSVLLTIAALTIAGVLVHREFGKPQVPSAVEERKSASEPGWQEIVAAGRMIGDSAAPIKVIEFADLECPFCRRYIDTLEAVRARYPKQVSLVFVHYPLNIHRFAPIAARVAECAGDQGRFSQMVNALYHDQASFGLKPWSTFAKTALVPDSLKFAVCVTDTIARPEIARGIAAARKFNVIGTPTVLVNDWRFGSTPTLEALTKAIDKALGSKGSQAH